MRRGVFRHPQALVESARIGAGTRIWAFAHVRPGAVIGTGCNIGDHCFIEGGVRLGRGVTVKNGVSLWEGVTVGDHAFIGPNAAFTNDRRPRSPRLPSAAGRYRARDGWLVPTRIGRGASIGANATVVCGVRIGAFALVAAGAVVTTDVPAYALWMGVPGRHAGWVCECGDRLRVEGAGARCAACRRRYALRRGRLAPVRTPR